MFGECFDQLGRPATLLVFLLLVALLYSPILVLVLRGCLQILSSKSCTHTLNQVFLLCCWSSTQAVNARHRSACVKGLDYVEPIPVERELILFDGNCLALRNCRYSSLRIARCPEPCFRVLVACLRFLVCSGFTVRILRICSACSPTGYHAVVRRLHWLVLRASFCWRFTFLVLGGSLRGGVAPPRRDLRQLSQPQPVHVGPAGHVQLAPGAHSVALNQLCDQSHRHVFAAGYFALGGGVVVVIAGQPHWTAPAVTPAPQPWWQQASNHVLGFASGCCSFRCRSGG